MEPRCGESLCRLFDLIGLNENPLDVNQNLMNIISKAKKRHTELASEAKRATSRRRNSSNERKTRSRSSSPSKENKRESREPGEHFEPINVSNQNGYHHQQHNQHQTPHEPYNRYRKDYNASQYQSFRLAYQNSNRNIKKYEDYYIKLCCFF